MLKAFKTLRTWATVFSVGGEEGLVDPWWDRRDSTFGFSPDKDIVQWTLISPTIHWYAGRRTDSTKSVENFQLGRGVGDNPLAGCRFNLDETRGWEFFDTHSWTSLVPYWTNHLFCDLRSCEGVVDWSHSQSSASNTTVRSNFRICNPLSMINDPPKEYCVLGGVWEDCCHDVPLFSSLQSIRYVYIGECICNAYYVYVYVESTLYPIISLALLPSVKEIIFDS